MEKGNIFCILLLIYLLKCVKIAINLKKEITVLFLFINYRNPPYVVPASTLKKFVLKLEKEPFLSSVAGTIHTWDSRDS